MFFQKWKRKDTILFVNRRSPELIRGLEFIIDLAILEISPIETVLEPKMIYSCEALRLK